MYHRPDLVHFKFKAMQVVSKTPICVQYVQFVKWHSGLCMWSLYFNTTHPFIRKKKIGPKIEFGLKIEGYLYLNYKNVVSDGGGGVN